MLEIRQVGSSRQGRADAPGRAGRMHEERQRRNPRQGKARQPSEADVRGKVG
jgi:hypothetical protein